MGSRSRGRRRSALACAAAAAAALCIALYLWRASLPPDAADAAQPSALARAVDPRGVAREQWLEMFRAEEQIHALSPQLRQLAFAVENLELPDARSRALFAAEVAVVDLDAGALSELALASRVSAAGADPAPPRRQSAAELRLWRPLLDRVAYFEHASFAIERGRFLDAAWRRFEAEVVFRGLARLRSGGISAIEARQTLRWRGKSPGEGADWRIVAWHTRELRRDDAAAPLFEEVLDRAIPDPQQRARARHSIHESFVLDFLLRHAQGGKEGVVHPFFTFSAQDRHPGVSVVDWDRDGFDDLYVMARWGRNQFLRNRGDGTFEEMAAQLGIDVSRHSSSAIFADFDNDGDADLFLGRTLARSAYFENREGRYVDRSAEAFDVELPYLVSSVSAVDYDRDGLLDLYVSTYAAAMLNSLADAVEEQRARGAWDPEEPFLGVPYFDVADARRILEAMAAPDYHPILDQVGPPNLLLRGVGGGRFERVDAAALSVYRNTYQASWADFDADGDADVYLANDFAPDSLVRNDGPAGFVDVSERLRGAELGLGMAATWGDYDRDGRQDLFVANMYSKAGSRITAQMTTIDPRFRQIASGNHLYRNDGEGLSRVSGEGTAPLAVERGGWAWGSLFADVDNDGFLDLFSVNGYYSAPPSVATAVDT